MNQLDFSNEKDELLEIVNRSKDIHKLVEVVHPEALKTMVVAQEKQKSKQNERDNVSNDIRHVGDKVALVNDGLLSKLESKYHGPYTVERVIRT